MNCRNIDRTILKVFLGVAFMLPFYTKAIFSLMQWDNGHVSFLIAIVIFHLCVIRPISKND
jgi:hypothetical protein